MFWVGFVRSAALAPTMFSMNFVAAAAIGYLLGSIPFGYLLVRIFRGEDVRQSGSGNIGATNVSRTSSICFWNSELLVLSAESPTANGNGTPAVANEDSTRQKRSRETR